VVNVNKENQESQDSYGWVILGIFTLAQLIMSVGAYAWGPLAPFLSKELGLTNTQIGSLTSVLYLTSVVIATPFGFFGRPVGGKSNADCLSWAYGFTFCCYVWVQ